MSKFTVKEKQPLKDFIAKSLSISKSKAKKLIDSKNVFVNSKRVWIASHLLNKGDIVEVPDLPKKALKEPNISQKDFIYEDEYIIAVNKPPFIISEGKKNSVEDKLRKLKGKSIKAIHRLDKETSGVLLFAKNYSIFERFKKLWEDKKVKKLYLAVLHGSLNFNKKIINLPIDKKPAKSVIKLIKKNRLYSLVEVDIKTGRKHQIRIHTAKIGYPVVGDKDYGIKSIDDPVLKSVKRQLLHSSKVEFFHPYKNTIVTITAPLLKDFKDFLEFLDLK